MNGIIEAGSTELVDWTRPRSLQDAIKIAEYFAKSELVPKAYQNKPHNIVVAMVFGQSLGLAAMQSLQSIAVINGNPSLYGDSLLALVEESGLLEYISEDVVDGVATCNVKRKGRPANVVRKFTMEQAKKARLLSKAGPWQDYPERMLQMRARSFALRDVFPDVLKGLRMAEEVMDDPEPVGTVTVLDGPKLGNAAVKQALKKPEPVAEVAEEAEPAAEQHWPLKPPEGGEVSYDLPTDRDGWTAWCKQVAADHGEDHSLVPFLRDVWSAKTAKRLNQLSEAPIPSEWSEADVDAVTAFIEFRQQELAS